jgi:hypothetical protein
MIATQPTGSTCSYSTGILSAMLEKVERIVNLDSGVRVWVRMDNADNATHSVCGGRVYSAVCFSQKRFYIGVKGLKTT